IMPAPPRRSCSDKLRRPRTARTGCRGSSVPSTCRRRNAGTGSPRLGLSPHPAVSRSSRHDAAVLHLHRRLQPALDVEQYPATVGMTTDRPEHQLPIDAVEETLDVEVEHPVVAPAALTSRAHGI